MLNSSDKRHNTDQRLSPKRAQIVKNLVQRCMPCSRALPRIFVPLHKLTLNLLEKQEINPKCLHQFESMPDPTNIKEY